MALSLKKIGEEMKYLLFFICLSGTCFSDQIEIQKQGFLSQYFKTYEYRNHTYIVFHGFREYSFVHDPDCQCMKNKHK